MIQRFIYTCLTQGLANIQADPSILDDIFCAIYMLGPREIQGIKDLFLKTPPSVQQGYAHIAATMPLYSIVLQGEEQSEFFLGDSAGQVLGAGISSPEYGADQTGAIWTSNYQILCYAEHPDVCTYMYEIAKSALLANSDYFIDNDVVDTILSGMDLMPDPRYVPEHLFVRVLGFRCKREFVRVERNSRIGKAFKVTGMSLPAGSPNTNGGALSLITPYADAGADSESE